MRGKKAKMIRKLAKAYVNQYAENNKKSFDEVANDQINAELKEKSTFSRPVYNSEGLHIGEKVFTGIVWYSQGMKVCVKNIKQAYKKHMKKVSNGKT